MRGRSGKPAVSAALPPNHIGCAETFRCSAVGHLEPEWLTPIRLLVAIAWIGETLSARPARETSLFGTPAFGGADRDEKARSVVALSRVPRLAGFAGSPPAAGFVERLTGLLSGSPPTDTRPQARAIWARRNVCMRAPRSSIIFRRPQKNAFTPKRKRSRVSKGRVKPRRGRALPRRENVFTCYGAARLSRRTPGNCPSCRT
jgi:hypothetical protein